MRIYMTINMINGKKYIGRDSLRRDKYLGSGIFLKKALSKYGKENFIKIIVEDLGKNASMKELIECEKKWINYFQAHKNPEFYNMSPGSGGFGKNHRHSDKTKKEISKIMKERVYKNGLPPEWRRNVTEAAKGREPWNKGKKFSKEEKEKIYGKRGRWFRPSDQDIADIKKLYSDGQPAYKIAERYKTSHHTILKIVREEGKYAKRK